MTLHPPTSVVELFTSAGWNHDRQVDVDVSSDHPAHALLSRFGGLRVGNIDGGEQYASSDIEFMHIPTDEDDQEISDWSELLATVLVGVGEVHNGHGELWLAADGRYFGRSLIHDAFYFHGNTFGEAMENLLLGRFSPPLIHPSQSAVEMYGEEYGWDHPDIYDYRRL